MDSPTGAYTSDTHEQWDGSSWTETTEINTTTVSAAWQQLVIQALGLKIGGTSLWILSPVGQTKTEFWNGSSHGQKLNDLSLLKDSI